MKRLLTIPLLFFTINLSAGITMGDYKNRDDVDAFVSRMAETTDYSVDELVDLFSQVKKQEHLFERLDRPAEKELQWHQYRPIFIKEKRIAEGVKFWRKHENLLKQVSMNTGVPEEIIVAIIGVETFYGIYKGKDPVFDSLVTISFDYPKRAKFFTRELEEFLLLAKEQNFKPREVMGSYAGAMGMPQFISSSYRSYAVDGDGDGRKNLFDSIADITASVANYFVRHGWKPNEAVAKPLIAVTNNSVAELEPGVKTSYKWSDLTRHGLASKHRIKDETPVALVKLEQKNHAEYWAGLKNFYVITRYNHSELYAMAVYQLSILIKARMKLKE
ncbi:MAG: lytic murein transglycosylase B [Gammaproteobacteria bacterium]|nr:lytic murein transglycosylase B [Gammaproteobacteria bacterium]